MAESSITITEGSGLDLHSNTRTISATTMHDQYVLDGEVAYASYIIAPTASYSIGTANDHFQIMAGASLNVRIRYIHIEVGVSAGTAGVVSMELWRLSTAGTGGTAYTPRPLDTADSASGATSMSLPTAKGTETYLLGRRVLTVRSAYSTLGGAEDQIDWVFYGNGLKSLIIPAGVTNGLAIKNATAVTSATIQIEVGFSETAFV